MDRLTVPERPDWKKQAEELGFKFHTMYGQPYWDERAAYRFSLQQVETIEDATADLERKCFDVVDRAASSDELLARLRIPKHYWAYIRESWNRRDKNLYGRYDFAYDGINPPKLLEYNADTPTSLYETAVFQWIWLEQAQRMGTIPQDSDQYNSIHEKLVDALGRFGLKGQVLHMSCVKGTEEDKGTVLYLQDCAVQAGLETRFIYLEDVGLDEASELVDLDHQVITDWFKLYPWEHMAVDEFGRGITASSCQIIEPVWKMILSNKGLLPILWEMYPDHPNLLPAYFDDDTHAADLGEMYVRKPLLSREGANVTIVRPKGKLEVPGRYGAEGYIRQAYFPLFEFDGNYAIIGSWTVASVPCGMGIREDNSPITKDTSRFIPHFFVNKED